MSLINQMLQDLEKRRAAPITGTDAPNQLRATAPIKSRSKLSPALLVVLVLALGIISWLLMQPPRQPAAPQPLGAANMGVPPPVAAVTAPSITPAPAVPAIPPQPPAIKMTVPTLSTLALTSELKSALPGPGSSRQEALSLQLPHAGEAATSAPRMVPVPAESGAATGAKPKSDDASSAINKQTREPTPEQRAENHYRKAHSLLQLGRVTQALTELGEALKIEPRHLVARQTLAGLLVEDKQLREAERQLEEGLKLNPEQAGFAMALARLQVERGAGPEALATMERALPFAADKSDYRAFYAALLQRQERHKEAIAQYQAALGAAPSSGVWLMGLGISLQAEKRLPEARDAFNRARASGTLSPELQAFVEQRLRQISQ